ncbi:hypothetical protein DFP72DRAFT_1074865 [Ephemerocybe angulata]|uniref:Uncharacterized protein n=1 Tax=Ephemerocybe angulata TaxID=980116 RepID=A0A8H6HJP5_9AGAR|nr:hypothetical protein DFP72DRAFT_1074865 [Tulosesus angulatus]
MASPSPSISERENAEGEKTPKKPPPKELPEELRRLIFARHLKDHPDDEHKVVQLCRWARKELFIPRSVQIRVEEYTSVFGTGGGISFGEIENLDITLPMDEEHLRNLLRALSPLRPLTQLKISSEGNRMDVEDYLEDVALITRCLPHAKVLTLKLPVPEYDFEELPLYDVWHGISFLRSLAALTQVEVFKLRTGFPVYTNDDPDIRSNEERAWHRKLVSHVPSLKQVYVHDSYFEGLEEGDGWVMGHRRMWHKEGGIWHNGSWLDPTAPSKRRKRMTYLPRGRSTKKEAFDAWGSDSECAEDKEYGW